MMASSIEPALKARLEVLTGDAACCVEDLEVLARRAREAPAFTRALAFARAMADEKRLTALALLKRKGELCACEVQAALGLTHATVSHHMGCLVESGLVDAERRGKWMYYSLTPAAKAVVP